MKTHPLAMAPALLVAASMLAPGLLQAQAQAPVQAASADPPISDQEFQSGIVNKSLLLKGADGKDYGLRLEDGGRAVVSLAFNDVGRWRPNGPGAYCVRWNKFPMDERCAYVTRREGRLAIMQANGTVASIQRVE